MINIQDIIPFMRKGWVAMDRCGAWIWYDTKPIVKKRFGYWKRTRDWCLLDIVFSDIAPAEDWTKSLIRVGNKPNNKVFDVDEFYKELFEND